MTNPPEVGVRKIDVDACEHAGNAITFLNTRWTSAVLLAAAFGAVRFGTYRRMVEGISDRMLSLRLKELQSRGLIRREVVPTMPVQVLYRISEHGRSLIDAMDPVARWVHARR
ncbi:winged helix-turn-helix transcriptional regulator [Umezawaea tangerina]|uniref:HxlR family transcriptional regulator n=1 Tax=Umezawaea tangerina TaxID=84725 RepID=A0A2T0T1F3_9PSEU|nr:helix-turn-helix domain-containing protein [Umezawaea tangerina]PRY39492.1 HxlR family transcriptional regulator [Umezawaea tangerina]